MKLTNKGLTATLLFTTGVVIVFSLVAMHAPTTASAPRASSETILYDHQMGSGRHLVVVQSADIPLDSFDGWKGEGLNQARRVFRLTVELRSDSMQSVPLATILATENKMIPEDGFGYVVRDVMIEADRVHLAMAHRGSVHVWEVPVLSAGPPRWIHVSNSWRSTALNYAVTEDNTTLKLGSNKQSDITLEITNKTVIPRSHTLYVLKTGKAPEFVLDKQWTE